MGDPMVPERLGGRHAVAREQTGIPAMPVIGSSEQVLGGAYPLLDGISPTIGWEFRSEAKGGPGFVILRRTADMVVQLADHGWPTLTRLLNRQALLDSIRVGDLGFMKAPHVELFFVQAEAVLIAGDGASARLDELLDRAAASASPAKQAYTARFAAWIRARAARSG